jgi:predicted regulator of Ras-like GTPase activity (Roadblock/LC7/MglB family)/gas vesicle protein
MLTSILLGLAGAVATGGGGYLVGVRARQRRIEQLTTELSGAQARSAALETSLAHERQSSQTAEQVATQVQSLITPMVGAQQAAARNLQAQMQALAERVANDDDNVERLDALRSELQHTLAPLLEQERQNQGIHKLMLDVLGPLMEKERRAQGLTLVSPNRRGRNHLPRLLDTLAHRGGFSAVLLSDEMGLPLAASSGARDADVLAGVSSLVLTLADRVTSSGGPAPLSVLLRDASNQRILHRIFSVGSERFLVTAVAKGGEISTDALDPALTALEDILASQAA